MTFYISWHFTISISWDFPFHEILHFMTFDISWNLKSDILHLGHSSPQMFITFDHTKNSNKPKVSRTGSNFAQHPINRINIQQTFSAYHRYGWHNLGMDNKPQIRSINRRNLTELKSWDDEMNYNWNMLDTLGTLGTITVVTMFDNKPGPIDPSLCQ